MNGDGVIDASDGKKTSAFDLWKSHPVEGVGHRWGMTIDSRPAPVAARV